MTAVAEVSPRWPTSMWVVVGGTMLLGGLAAAAGLSALPSWDAKDVTVCLGLAAAVAVGESFHIQLPYRRESTSYAVNDALWTGALFLVAPQTLMLAVALGVLVGQSLQPDWSRVKVAFNAAQFLLGITVAVLVFEALGAPAVTDPTGWLAAAAAMAAFQAVNTVLVGAVIALSEGQPFRHAALASTSALHWLGNIALGMLGALLWTVEPWALLLLLVPVVLTFLAYRGWLHSLQERDAMREMAATADAMSRSGDFTARVPVPPTHAAAGQLATTLNLMLDRLDGAFQRERRFIRETSHELRTPITIVRGHLEVLGPDPSPGEVAETAELVLDELVRMARLVDEMSLLSRLEDPSTLRPSDVQVDRLVADVAVKAAPLLDVPLQLSQAGTGGTLRADPQRLTQALINLLANAARHTPPGTGIALSVVPEVSTWRFQVADEGPGIASADADTVFLPFRTGRGPSAGSGLGLAIVAGVARAHGGTVGVSSSPDGGSSFWLRVPR